jgi:4-hydroxy-2-oxoglutarate aldolase
VLSETTLIVQLIKQAKAALKAKGNHGVVIAGTVGAQSTKEAIRLSKEAADAGADFTLVLPPSYFAMAMTPAAITKFYKDVSLTLSRADLRLPTHHTFR